MFTLNDLTFFNSLLEHYHVSDMDTATDPKYFGYLGKDSNWYILQLDETNGTLRYVKGIDDYTTNWTNRASLTYDYFDDVFD
jgi:hypothetical protein